MSKSNNKPVIVTTAIAILAKFTLNKKVYSEDIDVKLWELDSKRFGMITKDFPDAMSYDRDLARAKEAGWVYGSRNRNEYLEKDGFFLTKKGYEIALHNKHLFSSDKVKVEKDITENFTKNEMNIKINKFKSYKLYKDYALAISHNNLEIFYNKLKDNETIFLIAEMLGTSTDNLERLNRLFDELKLGASIHEENNNLNTFLEKVETYFSNYLNKDILVVHHSRKNKSKKGLKI